MKNALRTLLALFTLAVGGAALPAWASDSEPMHVSVPFSFRAGKTMLPAGEYTVSNDDSRIVMIKGSGGSAIVLAITSSEGDTTKSGISFDREGSGYCLKSIHSWGKGTATLVGGSDIAEQK